MRTPQSDTRNRLPASSTKAIDNTIIRALELLRTSHNPQADERISRFEKILADHARLNGCVHGEQCRTYREACTILTAAAAVNQ